MASKDRYYKEKEAAKLVAFYEQFEKFLAHYLELCSTYPDLAKIIEEKHPYLPALKKENESKP